MQKLIKWFKIIDDNLLIVLLGFFAFLIPLYPKIPFITVNYTYVAIRLEDFFVAILAGIFIIQVIRKKVFVNKYFLILFSLFWVIVFTSLYWNTSIAKNIVYEKVAFLHTFRRIEYMILFFIAYGAVKSTRSFIFLLYSFVSSTFLVIIYGICQRFIGFPAISTMNPEYAKGRVLFLTSEARISSTFAGHYDLSAYLVFAIPILWGLYIMLFSKKNKKGFSDNRISKIFSFLTKRLREYYTKSLKKIQIITDKTLHQELADFNLSETQFALLFLLGIISIISLSLGVNTYGLLIILVLTFCYSLYLIARRHCTKYLFLFLCFVSLYVLILTASRTSFIAYILSTPLLLLLLKKYKYFLIVLVISTFLMATNKDLTERFLSTFQVRQFLVDDLTGELYVVQNITSKELPAGTTIVYKIDKKSSQIKNTPETERIKAKIIKEASAAAEKKGGKGTREPEDITYQEISALAPDISFATRLQVEWPRAINAFKRNPLLGTGPSTITESTDNDYLRWLGEIGFLGFSSFLLIIVAITLSLFKAMSKYPENIKPLFLAPVLSIFGLLINALYIDVFEASKVAFMFWFIAGAYMSIIYSKYKLK